MDLRRPLAHLASRPAWAAPVAAVCCLLFAAAGTTLDVPQLSLVGALGQWDGGWYLSIARAGYWYRPGEQSPVAFFPAYPLAIRAVSQTGLGLSLSGVLLSLA